MNLIDTENNQEDKFIMIGTGVVELEVGVVVSEERLTVLDSEAFK